MLKPRGVRRIGERICCACGRKYPVVLASRYARANDHNVLCPDCRRGLQIERAAAVLATQDVERAADREYNTTDLRSGAPHPLWSRRFR